MSDINPRGGIGDNVQTIDFAKHEFERLKGEYGYLEKTVEDLEARSEPITVVDSVETKDVVKSLIKDMRDAFKRIRGVHEAEAAPHLERHRGTNGFFFGLMDRLGRRDKKAKEGEADRLNRLLTDWDTAELAREQEKRRREAEEAARIARERQEAEAKAAREAAEAARIAEEARLKAERARTDETRAARAKEAEAAAHAAREAAAALSETRVDATVAAARAEDSYVGTLASPADVMRQRGGDGILSTMGTEKFAEVTDRTKIDLEKLRSYLPIAAIETALRKYAESVGYSNDASVQIAGARFGKKPKSKVY
jgi:hypothetical protein